MFTQLGFIGHDAGHNQVFGARRRNRMLGLTVANALIGLSFGWWVPTAAGFARRQVVTARNIRGGRFTTLMLGGLNYQIWFFAYEQGAGGDVLMVTAAVAVQAMNRAIATYWQAAAAQT